MNLNTLKVFTNTIRFFNGKHFCRSYCQEAKKKKIFSGIQPTGNIHIGNYLGAIKEWVRLQNEVDDITLCIVDLHAITLPQKPEVLSRHIMEIAATLLACGINPDKCVLYQQSAVPQHTQLFWHLACVSTMARLSHLPQFKEKSATLKEVPLGLFIYPVLQAADILLFKATHVPVGDDQLQHLQLTQDLARMFNRRFGYTFPIPHAIVADNINAKIRSLRDPSKKMSKSDPDPKSRICLMDPPEVIRENIKKAVSDFTSQISYDPENRPGVSNLISIHVAVTGETVDSVVKQSNNLDTLQYKHLVADCVINHLQPIRKKFLEYMSEPVYLEEILRNGGNRAFSTAQSTLTEVKKKTGFIIESGQGELFRVKL